MKQVGLSNVYLIQAHMSPDKSMSRQSRATKGIHAPLPPASAAPAPLAGMYPDVNSLLRGNGTEKTAFNIPLYELDK